VEIDKEALENLNKEGMPIVNEPITLKFMTGKSPVTAHDYNEVTVWKEYAKLSNINIEWELVQSDGLEEKRNLALASGSLPDVFYTSHMPPADLLKYGEQGVFVSLNDLITEYMPNLTSLFEKYPETKKGITFPDGNIYSLPTIHDPDFLEVNLGMSHWIREDWLGQLGMDLPKTTDEYYEYLKAVKETDLNGNGIADEIPFGAHSPAGIKDVLKGAFVHRFLLQCP